MRQLSQFMVQLRLTKWRDNDSVFAWVNPDYNDVEKTVAVGTINTIRKARYQYKRINTNQPLTY